MVQKLLAACWPGGLVPNSQWLELINSMLATFNSRAAVHAAGWPLALCHAGPGKGPPNDMATEPSDFCNVRNL